MPSADLLSSFVIAAALFAYVPGPAMLYTAAQTLVRGRKAGLMATAGIHLGGYVHVVAAATGLSVLFHAVPVLYTAIKLVGAGYLIWLGLGMIRAAWAGAARLPDVAPRSAGRAFTDSAIVQILNPKVALFFLAFLPQFTDPAAAWPLWGQLLLLGVIVNALFWSADLACVALAGLVRRGFERSGAVRRWVTTLGGAVLIGLGIRLATQPRG